MLDYMRSNYGKIKTLAVDVVLTRDGGRDRMEAGAEGVNLFPLLPPHSTDLSGPVGLGCATKGFSLSQTLI